MNGVGIKALAAGAASPDGRGPLCPPEWVALLRSDSPRFVGASPPLAPGGTAPLLRTIKVPRTFIVSTAALFDLLGYAAKESCRSGGD